VSDHEDEDTYEFPVIKPVILGKLPESLLHDWRVLEGQVTKLEEAYAAAAKAVAFFQKIVAEAMQVPCQPDGERVPFDIFSDGEVVLKTCTCPVCQAKRNKMPVSEVIEKMHAMVPFPPEVLVAFQLRARLVDELTETRQSEVH